MIKFEKDSTLGIPSQIVVKQLTRFRPNHSKNKKDGTNSYLAKVGWISEHPQGSFRYYEPITNELNPSFTSDDLESLKEQVERHLERKI